MMMPNPHGLGLVDDKHNTRRPSDQASEIIRKMSGIQGPGATASLPIAMSLRPGSGMSDSLSASFHDYSEYTKHAFLGAGELSQQKYRLCASVGRGWKCRTVPLYLGCVCVCVCVRVRVHVLSCIPTNHSLHWYTHFIP